MKESNLSFDYIIAGGGTAGCVLAARLTEDPTVSVLLLETGKSDTHPFIHVPAGFAKLTAGPFQWGYQSQPQKHARNRVIPLAQGKVLGGGGSINAQVYTRGVPEDFDEWANRDGCTGWDSATMLEYFKKSEDNERLSGKYHGNDGPLGVSDLANPHELTQAFVKSGQQMGLPYNSDFNGESQLGVGYYQATTRNGRRCSTAVGFLHQANGRKNLKIKVKTSVVKILMVKNRAVGVAVLDGSKIIDFKARKEVIITAGAFGSPKLLQLSGIGDPADLKAVGIDVKHSLVGVGKNLQDHCDLDIVYSINKKISMDRMDGVNLNTAKAGLEYLMFKRGPLASTVVEGGMFSYANENEKTPDLQFHFLPAAGVEAGIGATKKGLGVTINSYFLRPRSRGTVRIAASDPSVAPLIDPNYLAEEYDLESTIVGLQQMREIMHQPAISKYITQEHLAGGKKLNNKDSYIDFVRSFGRTSYHPVGTCAMGISNESVVTPELKVYGIEGLRIADSSVMPRIVSSNTQATTVAIAERAADLILNKTK
jgi:choline dehydrogenase-like flavoprotein